MTMVKQPKTSDVYAALTDNWQTCAMIACQVPIAPDAIHRMIQNAWFHASTEASAKTHLVAKCLSGMYRRNKIERRFNETIKKYEYRLPCN